MTTARERLVLAKNAGANIVRGSSTALVALLLPPFLTRSMPVAAYGAWMLVLQLAAYVSYLDFGIQTAVSRFVAHTRERGDQDHQDRIVSTSLVILGTSGLVAWLAIILFLPLFPFVFRQLPPSLLHQVRVTLVLVAGSLAVGLPASVFTAVFLGLQRNDIPAAAIGVSKILGAFLVVLIVHHGGDLIAMGSAVAVTNLLSYLFQYLICRRVSPNMHLSLRLLTRSAANEIVRYCLSLTVWSIGLLLVTGLDLTVVGYYRFNQVAYYAVAATVVTFFAGFYNAVVTPMIPAAAVLHAREDTRGLGRMVLVSTRYGMLLLLGLGLPIVGAAHTVLKIWVGQTYAANAAFIVQILVIANIIRLSVTPYGVAMIGTGEQRLVILTPLLEGITNLAFSLIAGYFMGAIGVAIGTLVGSIVGLLGMLIYNLPRIPSIELGIGEYVRESLGRPVLCAIPVMMIIFMASVNPGIYPRILNGLAAGSTVLSLTLVWAVGLLPQERNAVIRRILSNRPTQDA